MPSSFPGRLRRRDLRGSTVPTTSPRSAIPLHPDALARFVDPLPIPATIKPDGERPDPDAGARGGQAVQDLPYYRVAMREGTVAVHRDLPPTRVWGYGGTFPGPTFETRSGKGLLVEWANELPERHFLPIDHGLCGAGADQPEVRTVVHVHGARVPPESDGLPRRLVYARTLGACRTTRTSKTPRRSGTTTTRWASSG